MKIELNGRPAYAYTGGKPFDPGLPTVVLIHGALNDHSVWALQSRYLAHHGWSVLAVDLPGHGLSAGPALESVDAMADWVVALADAAHAGRCALVGHSMGSLVAMSVAAALGERATHLAMVATAYPMKVSEALLKTAAADPERAIDMVTTFSHSTIAAKPSAPGPGAWLHGAARALMRQLQARYAAAGHGNLFLTDFKACDRYGGGQHAARRVRCPVRMVLGAKDAMTLPKSAAELVRELNAGVVTLPAGHALMAEAPDAVLDALVGFIRPESRSVA
jgi:pimeloyl-ACP methyl ester carboxylesterase